MFLLPILLSTFAFAIQVPFQVQNPRNASSKAAGSIIDWKVGLYVRKMMLQYQIPGLAIAVVKDGQIETDALGFKSEWGEKATVDTLFDIGSCSKAFASMSLGILIEDFSTGKNTTPLPSSLTSLSWQTKVIDLLPDLWALDDKYASSKVSLSDLVSHVTGLPRHDLSYAPGQTVKSRIETLRDLKPTHELREKWSYNNIMYMALSHIISTLSGTPYDAFVKERIFDVLGMHSTTFAHLVPQDSKARSQGWDAVSGRRIPLIDPRSAELIAGAGGVVSTAHDMGKWLLTLLSNGADPLTESQLLPVSAVEGTTNPRAAIVDSTRTRFLSDPVYAAGWIRDSYKGRHRTWHNGGIHGFLSWTSFYPFDNVGIFISFNKWGVIQGVEQLIANGVADLVMGLPSSGDESFLSRESSSWKGCYGCGSLRFNALKGGPEPSELEDKALWKELEEKKTAEMKLGESLTSPFIPSSKLNPILSSLRPFLNASSLGFPVPLAGTYSHPVYGSIHLCMLNSLQHPASCDITRREFRVVGTNDQYGAKIQRVFGSHIWISKVVDEIYLVSIRNVFPTGYGWNKRPFYTEIGTGLGVFVPNEGFGMYLESGIERLPTQANPTREEVEKSSEVWFDWSAFPS